MQKFEFKHPVSEDDRIGMTEWRRLKGCTSYDRLRIWIQQGVRTKAGRALKLPSFRFGNRTYTTAEAYQWWVEAQQL